MTTAVKIEVNRAFIDEDNATWDINGQRASGLVSERVLKRKFTHIPIRELSTLAENLRLRTSTNNPNNGQKYYSITDPKVNKIAVPGLWRGVLVETVEDSETKGTIIQTLHYGWAQSIVWEDARLVEGQKLQESENYLTIQWVALDATKIDAMARGLNAVSYDAIVQKLKVNTEEITGTWRNIKVVPSLAQDGSGIITLYLAQPQFTLSGYQNALTTRESDVSYQFQVPKDLSAAIIAAHKTTKGNSASVSYPNASGLVDIALYSKKFNPITKSDVLTEWDCAHKAFTTTYLDLTESQADAVILTEPSVGWSYSARKQDSGDGSWDVVVIKRNSLYRDIPFQTSEISAESMVETRQQLGLTTETQEAMTSTDGVIKQQRVDAKDDCSKDVVTRKETGTAQTSYVREVSPSGVSTTTAKTVQSSPLGTPVLAKGHLKRNVDRASKFPNRYDTEEHDIQPTDQTADGGEDTGFESKTHHIHTENSDVPTVPAATQGTKTSLDARPTQSGNLQTAEETSTSKHVSVPEFVSRYGERSTEYISEEIHALTPPILTDETAEGIETALLSHNYDDYLTHNYKKQRSVKKFPFEGELSFRVFGDIETSVSQVYSETLGHYWTNAAYKYQRVTTRTFKYFKTLSEALAFINGEFLTNNEGSTWHHTGEYEYLAEKVINSKSAISPVPYEEYLEPLS